MQAKIAAEFGQPSGPGASLRGSLREELLLRSEIDRRKKGSLRTHLY